MNKQEAKMIIDCCNHLLQELNHTLVFLKNEVQESLNSKNTIKIKHYGKLRRKKTKEDYGEIAQYC
jgi:nucleoid DNA-binding protein